MAQTIEAELVRTVRAITRLQTQARKLRQQLKENQKSLRFERKCLKGLQGQLEDRRPDVAPMRLFSGEVGLKAHD